MHDMTLAYRLELDGRGPFWSEKAFQRMVRECRKVTPEWKKESPVCSSFVEHYIANADVPHENPSFDFHLSFLKCPEGSLGFGFVSKEALAAEFQLGTPLYEKQFFGVLSNCESVRLQVYVVKPAAVSDTECLFRWRDAEHLQTICTQEEFECA